MAVPSRTVARAALILAAAGGGVALIWRSAGPLWGLAAAAVLALYGALRIDNHTGSCFLLTVLAMLVLLALVMLMVLLAMFAMAR